MTALILEVIRNHGDKGGIEPVEFIHLWWVVHEDLRVLHDVLTGTYQVREGPAANTLEIHMATLSFFFFP